MIIPIFLTNLGCVHRCIYCSQKIASGQDEIKAPEDIYSRITSTMEEYLSHYTETEEKLASLKLPLELAIYGSNFTAIPFNEQKSVMSFIKQEFERILGMPSNTENLIIRISTSPLYIKKEQLLDLKIRFNLALVEIGVQSMDQEVLLSNGRNYTTDTVKEAAKIIRNMGLILSCHQMIGMYGASFPLDIRTTREIIKLKPHFVRIHPTIVLKGTLLEKLYMSGEYTPLSLDDAVSQLIEHLQMYKEADIKVIRVGLHPSDIMGENIVAGPWHDSLRQLVETETLKRKVFENLESRDLVGKNIAFKISPKDETYLRGKDNNIYNEITETFRLDAPQIVLDDNMERGQFEIIEL